MITPTDGPKVKVDYCSFPRDLFYVRKLEVPLSHRLPISLDSAFFMLGNEHHSLVTLETVSVFTCKVNSICLPLVVSTVLLGQFFAGFLTLRVWGCVNETVICTGLYSAQDQYKSSVQISSASIVVAIKTILLCFWVDVLKCMQTVMNSDISLFSSKLWVHMANSTHELHKEFLHTM